MHGKYRDTVNRENVYLYCTVKHGIRGNTVVHGKKRGTVNRDSVGKKRDNCKT